MRSPSATIFLSYDYPHKLSHTLSFRLPTSSSMAVWAPLSYSTWSGANLTRRNVSYFGSSKHVTVTWTSIQSLEAVKDYIRTSALNVLWQLTWAASSHIWRYLNRSVQEIISPQFRNSYKLRLYVCFFMEGCGDKNESPRRSVVLFPVGWHLFSALQRPDQFWEPLSVIAMDPVGYFLRV